MKRNNISLRGQISQGIKDSFTIWKEEMVKTFHDQGMLIFFILVPLVYPLVYSFIYTEEVVRDVPVVAVDMSDSSLSREFLRKVDATPDVKIVSHCTDLEEAKELMKEQKAYGTIYIPDDFTDKLARMEQSPISIFCDMSGLLYYKSLLLSATEVSLEMNKDIKIERAGNFTERQDEITAMPIEYTDVAMFNPQNGFASFLIPAVLVLIIQQTLMLGIGLSVGTAREKNIFKDLVPISRHYNGTFRIVFGKSLCYFFVYAVMSTYILCIVPKIFSLPQIGDLFTLLLFMLPYIFACIFFSMTMSAAIKNRETCMLIFVFTSVPLLFLSGISWPGSAIPPFWKAFSYIFPSTFGINGFVRINSMGAELHDVEWEYGALWIQCGIYFITTCIVYRWQIIRSRKHAIKAHLEEKRLRSLQADKTAGTIEAL